MAALALFELVTQLRDVLFEAGDPSIRSLLTLFDVLLLLRAMGCFRADVDNHFPHGFALPFERRDVVEQLLPRTLQRPRRSRGGCSD